MERASYSFSIEYTERFTEAPGCTKLNFLHHWNSKIDCTTKKTKSAQYGIICKSKYDMNSFGHRPAAGIYLPLITYNAPPTPSPHYHSFQHGGEMSTQTSVIILFYVMVLKRTVCDAQH